MSAQIFVRQPSVVGPLRLRRHSEPASAATATPAVAATPVALPGPRSVHLTGASMRFLEMGLAVASIATAVFIGAGR